MTACNKRVSPTRDPPLSILPHRPSTPCETPVPQTRRRNYDPVPSAPDADRTTTADSEGSGPGHRGTPAPRLSHPHSSTTLRRAIPARERTNPEVRRTSAYPAPRPRLAGSSGACAKLKAELADTCAEPPSCSIPTLAAHGGTGN